MLKKTIDYLRTSRSKHYVPLFLVIVVYEAGEVPIAGGKFDKTIALPKMWYFELAKNQCYVVSVLDTAHDQVCWQAAFNECGLYTHFAFRRQRWPQALITGSQSQNDFKNAIAFSYYFFLMFLALDRHDPNFNLKMLSDQTENVHRMVH